MYWNTDMKSFPYLLVVLIPSEPADLIQSDYLWNSFCIILLLSLRKPKYKKIARCWCCAQNTWIYLMTGKSDMHISNRSGGNTVHSFYQWDTLQWVSFMERPLDTKGSSPKCGNSRVNRMLTQVLLGWKQVIQWQKIPSKIGNKCHSAH